MDIMLDLETFGRGNNAAIVQIGAVKFDRKTGEIDPSHFSCNVSAESCVKAGMEMDADTVQWWMQQGDEARKSILNPVGQDIKASLILFNRWIDSHNDQGGSKNNIHLWSHATFDFPIFLNAFDKCDIKPSFSFRGARDLRTLTDMADVLYWTEEYQASHPRTGLYHNALDDCIYQVGYAVESLQKIANALMVAPSLV